MDNTLKTSTVFVGIGKNTRVYRSLDEVPPALRVKLLKTTAKGNAVSILIADRKGQQEIVKAVRGLPSRVTRRVPRRPAPHVRFRWREWLEIAAPGALGLAAWLLFTWR
jgi:hypothetical protein